MYRSLFLKGVVSLLLWTGSVPLFASSSAESQFLHPSMFQVVVQGSMYSNFGAETEGSRKSQSLYYQAEKSVLLSDVEQFSALLAQVIRDPSQVNSDVLQKFGFLIHRLISSDLEINATSQLQTLIEFNQRHGLFTHQEDVQWLSANLHFLKSDLKALRKRVSASVGDIHVLAYISWLISRLDNNKTSIQNAIDLHQQMTLSLSERVRYADLLVRQFAGAEFKQAFKPGPDSLDDFIRIENLLTQIRMDTDPVLYPLIYTHALRVWAALLGEAAEKQPQSAATFLAQQDRVMQLHDQMTQTESRHGP